MTENRIEIVKRNCDELTEAWRNEEYKHDTYTIFLDNSEVEANVRRVDIGVATIIQRQVLL